METLQQLSFDYTSVDSQTANTLKTYAVDIKTLMRQTLEHILAVGQRLQEAQVLLRHNKQGGFRAWCQCEFDFSYKTAYRFIHVTQHFANCDTVSQLDIPVKALYMLAAPSTPEPARQEALNRAEQGETITYTLAQEIVHEHKSHEPSQPEALQVPKEIPTPEETPQKPQIPHVAHNSGENEWYTPPEYIAAAHLVLGDIDLDPASSPVANEIVQAKRIFTRQENGLTQEWQGKIWMNPPYEVKLIDQFCDKLHTSVLEGRVSEAIVLVNNATETRWFHTLINIAAAVVFPTSRIKFHSPTGVMGAPLQGQAFIYIGARQDRFLTAFRSFGWGAVL